MEPSPEHLLDVSQDFQRASIRPEPLITGRKAGVFLGILLLGLGISFATSHPTGLVQEFFHHVGIFIAAVVAVHFLYEVFVKRHDQQKLRAQVSETIGAFLPAYERWGFRGFSQRFDPRTLFARLTPGDQLLWLDTVALNINETVACLEEALSRGVHVRMLVLAPDSPIVAMRAAEVIGGRHDADSMRGELRSFLDKLAKVASDFPTLQVLQYSDLPCVPMYIRVQDGAPIEAQTGYFLSASSEVLAHARWGTTASKDSMLIRFVDYFEAKWRRAERASAHKAPSAMGGAA